MANKPRARTPRSPARVVAIGGTASVVCLLPLFLTGSMATFIQDDLRFGAAGLGIAVALNRAAGAVSSPLLGRQADRFGATRSLRLATGTAAVAALGIALTATSTVVLIAWLMLVGCAVALAQPAANRLLASGIGSSGLGTAFGFKQSAPPVASMLAGLSVPLIAVNVGWRWAFVAAAGLAAFMTLGVRPVARLSRPRPVPEEARTRADRTTILTLALAFGLGTSCSSSVTTFFVLAMVERGTGDVIAGTWLAVGSLMAVATRVVAGMMSDRTSGNHLRGSAALAAVGACGIAALAVADSVPIQAIAVVVALAGTWGFNGVFWFALIKAFPGSPGRITGSVAPGGLLGSTFGPIAFGLIAETLGYTVAFSVFTVVALATAAVLLIGNRRLCELADH